MAKYKLTVKYDGVCDLSIAGDIPNIIANEFDQYVKSMLYKKEEWENFEANFKVAAKQEYTNQKKEAEAKEAQKEANTEAKTEAEAEIEPQKTLEQTVDDAPVVFEKEETEKDTIETTEAPETNADTNDENTLQDGFSIIDNIEPLEEKRDENSKETPGDENDENAPTIKVEIKNEKILSFEKYIDGKKINSALDEFVVGACYLDEILNIKEFTLKEINAKLFPAFGRLASSAVINEAQKRVLIEIFKKSNTTKYKINENAWNYHNYDLITGQ